MQSERKRDTVMTKRNIAFGFIVSCFAVFLMACLFNPGHTIENASSKLSIIGPYGDNEAYHPKVLYFENGWNGYTYWLSYTPYPHADDTKEDPCIACSNDLETWVTPSGLINPLSRRDNGRGYNSDAHLVYNNDQNCLECWWRYVDDEAETETSTIYRVTTIDGLHWTEKEIVFHANDRKQSLSDWVSPSVIYENGVYKLWYVVHRTVYYTESTNLQVWTEPIDCAIPVADGTKIWHIDVIATDLGYEMLSVNYKNNAKNHHGMSLYYAQSPDETSWDTPARPILSPGDNAEDWDAMGIYRTTFLKDSDGYNLLYSAYSLDGTRGIGLIRDIKDLRTQECDKLSRWGTAVACIGLIISLAVWLLTCHLNSWVYKKFIILKRHQFLFEELVKRDFKKKYKRTVLGMAWSVLSPLLTLLVMRLVFTQFFGRNTPHYTTYLFCGNLVFSYFNESTGQGMTSLMGNAGIFSKVNVPKYLFLFSKNVQTLINFGLTLCVFFVFCVLDNITFTWKFICLLFPVGCLVLFNIGVGLILSALFVFFRDIQYLWSVFTQLLMYMSAIFYTIDNYSPMVRNLFLLNPVYLFIRYFRKIVIDATIPSVWFHLLMLADVAIVLAIGCWVYKKYNHKFLYYV